MNVSLKYNFYLNLFGGTFEISHQFCPHFRNYRTQAETPQHNVQLVPWEMTVSAKFNLFILRFFLGHLFISKKRSYQKINNIYTLIASQRKFLFINNFFKSFLCKLCSTIQWTSLHAWLNRNSCPHVRSVVRSISCLKCQKSHNGLWKPAIPCNGGVQRKPQSGQNKISNEQTIDPKFP